MKQTQNYEDRICECQLLNSKKPAGKLFFDHFPRKQIEPCVWLQSWRDLLKPQIHSVVQIKQGRESQTKSIKRNE